MNLLVKIHLRLRSPIFQLLTAKYIASLLLSFNLKASCVDMQSLCNSIHNILLLIRRLVDQNTLGIHCCYPCQAYRKVQGVKVIVPCNCTCQFEQTSLL